MPTDNDEVEKVARPPLSGTDLIPAPPSVKVTLPEGVGWSGAGVGADTVAFRVTACPEHDWLGETWRLVLVESSALAAGAAPRRTRKGAATPAAESLKTLRYRIRDLFQEASWTDASAMRRTYCLTIGNCK